MKPSKETAGKNRLDSRIERLRGRAADAVARSNEVALQLPLWADGKRGAPNSFLRSALFAAIQSKDRAFFKDEVLASQDGIVVKFTGEQLNQADLDLWETIVHAARDFPLGTPVTVSAYELLKSLGLQTGNSQYKQLHTGILRQIACAVQVTHEDKTYIGPLIKSAIKDEIKRTYVLELNREIIHLYGENKWSAIDWEQRRTLRGQSIAQALHAYFSSHKNPYPVKLETLKKFTGSKAREMKGFRRMMREALELLIEIGFLKSFSMENDLVAVQRNHPPQLDAA